MLRSWGCRVPEEDKDRVTQETRGYWRNNTGWTRIDLWGLLRSWGSLRYPVSIGQCALCVCTGGHNGGLTLAWGLVFLYSPYTDVHTFVNLNCAVFRFYFMNFDSLLLDLYSFPASRCQFRRKISLFHTLQRFLVIVPNRNSS